MEKELSISEKTRQIILQWIYDNHLHHDHEEILREGSTNIYDEKWVDCDEAEYPYVNSIELEKFIKEL